MKFEAREYCAGDKCQNICLHKRRARTFCPKYFDGSTVNFKKAKDMKEKNLQLNT